QALARVVDPRPERLRRPRCVSAGVAPPRWLRVPSALSFGRLPGGRSSCSLRRSSGSCVGGGGIPSSASSRSCRWWQAGRGRLLLLFLPRLLLRVLCRVCVVLPILLPSG